MDIINIYNGNLNIVDLYEDLRKYIKKELRDEYDDMFYDAPEGEVQIDIVKEILNSILEKI